MTQKAARRQAPVSLPRKDTDNRCPSFTSATGCSEAGRPHRYRVKSATDAVPRVLNHDIHQKLKKIHWTVTRKINSVLPKLFLIQPFLKIHRISNFTKFIIRHFHYKGMLINYALPQEMQLVFLSPANNGHLIWPQLSPAPLTLRSVTDRNTLYTATHKKQTIPIIRWIVI